MTNIFRKLEEMCTTLPKHLPLRFLQDAADSAGLDIDTNNVSDGYFNNL